MNGKELIVEGVRRQWNVITIIRKLIGNFLRFELRSCSAVSSIVQRCAVVIVVLDAKLRDQLDQFVLRSLVHPRST